MLQILTQTCHVGLKLFLFSPRWYKPIAHRRGVMWLSFAIAVAAVPVIAWLDPSSLTKDLSFPVQLALKSLSLVAGLLFTCAVALFLGKKAKRYAFVIGWLLVLPVSGIGIMLLHGLGLLISPATGLSVLAMGLIILGHVWIWCVLTLIAKTAGKTSWARAMIAAGGVIYVIYMAETILREAIF